MHSHHARALATIAAAAMLDAALGACFGLADHIGIPGGLWFATVTATTVGYGDVIPRGWLPHLLAVAIMITVIPLFAAAFSLFTSGLADVDGAEERIKDHVNGALRRHLGGT